MPESFNAYLNPDLVLPLGCIEDWIAQPHLKPENASDIFNCITTTFPEKAEWLEGLSTEFANSILTAVDRIRDGRKKADTEAQWRDMVLYKIQSLRDDLRKWQFADVLYTLAANGGFGGPIRKMRTKTQFQYWATACMRKRTGDASITGNPPTGVNDEHFSDRIERKLKTMGVTSKADWQAVADQLFQLRTAGDVFFNVGIDAGRIPPPHNGKKAQNQNGLNAYRYCSGRLDVDGERTEAAHYTLNQREKTTDVMALPPFENASEPTGETDAASELQSSEATDAETSLTATTRGDTSAADAIRHAIDLASRSVPAMDVLESDADRRAQEDSGSVHTKDAGATEGDDSGDADAVAESSPDVPGLPHELTDTYDAEAFDLQRFLEIGREEGFPRVEDQCGQSVQRVPGVQHWRRITQSGDAERSEEYIFDLVDGVVYVTLGISGSPIFEDVCRAHAGDFSGRPTDIYETVPFDREDAEALHERHERLERLLDRAMDAGMFNEPEAWNGFRKNQGMPPEHDMLNTLEERIEAREFSETPREGAPAARDHTDDRWEAPDVIKWDCTKDEWFNVITGPERIEDGTPVIAEPFYHWVKHTEEDPSPDVQHAFYVEDRKVVPSDAKALDRELYAYEILPQEKWENAPKAQRESLMQKQDSMTGKPVLVKGESYDTEIWRIWKRVTFYPTPFDWNEDASDTAETPDRNEMEEGPTPPSEPSTNGKLVAWSDNWPALQPPERRDYECQMAGKYRGLLVLLFHYKVSAVAYRQSNLSNDRLESLKDWGMIEPVNGLLRPTPKALVAYEWIVNNYGQDARNVAESMLETFEQTAAKAA